MLENYTPKKFLIKKYNLMDTENFKLDIKIFVIGLG